MIIYAVCRPKVGSVVGHVLRELSKTVLILPYIVTIHRQASCFFFVICSVRLIRIALKNGYIVKPTMDMRLKVKCAYKPESTVCSDMYTCIHTQ